MYRIFLLTIALIIAISNVVQAQEDSEELGPDDIRISVPKDAIFVEGPDLEDVIEGVGTITSSVPVYTQADKSSKILRYGLPGEKVLVVANNEGWYRVRMYNNKEGFIEKKSLKTIKVFFDESVSATYVDKRLVYIDKRLNIELHSIVNRFNNAMMKSVYLEKYQIVPRLVLVNSWKKDDIITINLEYSAVDKYGNIVPSNQVNTLQGQMHKFIGLLYMKMLVATADSYKIIIKKPVFVNQGRVLNTQGDYAELVLKYDAVDPVALKKSSYNILDIVECDITLGKLFEKYPL